MKLKRACAIILAVTLLTIVPSLMIPLAYAAPSGTIDDPVSPENPENILTFDTPGELGETEQVVITFWNIKGATPEQLTDVASTIQYIALGAINMNPDRVSILATASWEIWTPGDISARASGTVAGQLEANTNACVPADGCLSGVDLHTWALGRPGGPDNIEEYTSSDDFDPALRILRPGERLELEITVQCAGIEGDSRIWFFFRATEWAPSDETDPTTYPTTIGTIPEAQRWNLYYSKLPGPVQTKYWLPLHNSYDPYDTDIGDPPPSGHNFDQHSWERNATISAFAKSNKLVHQTRAPPPDGGQQLSTIHICGTKFNDVDGDGVYDVEFDPGIDGVTVMLLGADAQTLASQYYPGQFNYPVQEGDIMVTGENNLLGSYCFNLENALPGTYTFYIKIEEPPGRFPTTPTMIGPITIVVPEASTVILSANRNFGNSLSAPPVGGVILPVSQLGLLAAWVGLLGLLAAVISIVGVSKKRKN